MKKTIIALLALAGAAVGAVNPENALLISFGGTSGGGITYETGSFLEESELTYNIISTTGGTGYTATSLKLGDGTGATGMSVVINQAVSGNNGKVTTITNVDKVNKIFDSSLMSSVVNHNTSDITVTIDGLTVGSTYTMYAFAGRGNSYADNLTTSSHTNTYSLHSGAKDITAQIISYTVTTPDRPIPTVSNDLSSVTAFTQSCNGINQSCENWAIMAFDFTASNSTLVFKGTGDGAKNIGALGLVKNIPEPTTATLSLLALAGLAARRRRR